MLIGNRIYSAISLSVLLCIFRRPLEMILPLKAFSPVFVFLPLTLVVFLFFQKKEKEHIFRILLGILMGREHRLILVFGIYLVLYLAGLSFSEEGNIPKTIYELMQTTIFLLFPVVSYLIFNKEELVRILELTLKSTLVISFFLTVMEFLVLRLHFLSPMEIRVLLLGVSPDIPNGGIRINSFMGQGAISGLIPLSGYAYFLFKIMEEYLSGSKIRKSEIVMIFLGGGTVLLCDSILLFVIVVLVPLIVISYFVHQKSFPGRDVVLINRFFLIVEIGLLILSIKILPTNLPSKIYLYFFSQETVVKCDMFLFLLVGILTLPLFIYHVFLYRYIPDRARFDRIFVLFGTLSIVSLILVLGTSISDRLYSYFFNQHEISSAVKSYGPKLSGCNSWSLIFGVPFVHNFGLGTNCLPGEFHGFQMVFRTGLILQIPWLAFLIYPLVLFVRSYNRKKSEVLFKFALGATMFVVPEIHYAGVEIWGNNYVFGLFVVIVVNVNKKVDHPGNKKSLFDRIYGLNPAIEQGSNRQVIFL